jgi:hypothetical protein
MIVSPAYYTQGFFVVWIHVINTPSLKFQSNFIIVWCNILDEVSLIPSLVRQTRDESFKTLRE